MDTEHKNCWAVLRRNASRRH